jgi:hypothetical protein
MASHPSQTPKLDRYVVIHAATTCDEHGVYVTKDSAEVIELGWILLDAKTCEEVCVESTLQGKMCIHKSLVHERTKGEGGMTRM